MEDFIRDYVSERIELSSSPDIDDGSVNDIQGWLQTIYESCLETEAYVETAELIEKIDEYIEASTCKTSLCTPEELVERSKEIVDMLLGLDIDELDITRDE